MKRENNPFLTYMNTHPGSDAVALKQLFRMLAKRTHPDLGAENEADFVRLQDAYNEAVAELIRRQEIAQTGGAGTSELDPTAGGIRGHPGPAGAGAFGGAEIWLPSTPRERVLHFLYRYKAHLPSLNLEPGPVPPACRRAFANALEAAANYTDECRYTLGQFHEQFHGNRAAVARFPEVTTKYRPLVQGLASFFDYLVMPNRFNQRIVSSYLSEIKPVTDIDPGASPEVRANRSAAARSAIYRMRVWLETEMAAGPCRVL